MKKILFWTITPICVIGMFLLLLFLGTMSVVTIKCYDGDNYLFKEISIIKSMYDTYVFPQEIVGYEFLGWEDGSKEGFNLSKLGNMERVAKYATNTDMPTISIKTQDKQEINSKEEYTPSTISVTNCEENFIFSDVSAGVRWRGNSTLQAPKKPYRIKFDSKRNILGLNNGSKFKSWVLLADWYDLSYSRNYINFYIGSKLNIYCSDFKHVEQIGRAHV